MSGPLLVKMRNKLFIYIVYIYIVIRKHTSKLDRLNKFNKELLNELKPTNLIPMEKKKKSVLHRLI